MQIHVDLIHDLRSAQPHEKRPVVLVRVLSSALQAMPVPYQNHDTFSPASTSANTPFDVLFDSALGICERITCLELGCERRVGSRGGRGPAHGTICLEVIGRIIVRVKRGEVEIEAGVRDMGRG